MLATYTLHKSRMKRRTKHPQKMMSILQGKQLATRSRMSLESVRIWDGQRVPAYRRYPFLFFHIWLSIGFEQDKFTNTMENIRLKQA